MSNLAKIYNEMCRGISDPPREQEGKSPAEDAARLQAKINWLQSTPTQDMVTQLHSEYQKYIENAISVAERFPELDAIYAIKFLVRAKQIRDIINTYARPSSNS